MHRQRVFPILRGAESFKLSKLSDDAVKSLAKVERRKNEHDDSCGLGLLRDVEDRVNVARESMERILTKEKALGILKIRGVPLSQ